MEKRKKTRTKPKPEGTIPAFLLKTYEILENPEYHDIATWNKDGTAFVIKNVTEFSDKILPKYFKHSNFASFVRQLNMYDFHKSRHETNENEFTHPNFRRGEKQLLSEIKRKTAETQDNQQNQLVLYSKDNDIEKYKKDALTLSHDLKLLSSRQNDLEKVANVIFTQNKKLISENKMLWNKLVANKDKYERKIDKIMYFMMSMMQLGNSGPGVLEAMKKKKKALGLCSDSPDVSDVEESDEHNKNCLSVASCPTGQEKFYKNMTKYWQNKTNKNNLERWLDMVNQGSPKLDLGPQYESVNEDENNHGILGNGEDNDLISKARNISKRSKATRATKGGNKQNTTNTNGYDNYIQDTNDRDELVSPADSRKMLKTEYRSDEPFMNTAIPLSNTDQDIYNQNGPMDYEYKNDEAQTDHLLSPGVNGDSTLAPYPINSSKNDDFLLQSPRLFMNLSRQDSIPNFNQDMADKDFFGDTPKINPMLDDGNGLESPHGFLNNDNNDNLFGFAPSFEETFGKD